MEGKMFELKGKLGAISKLVINEGMQGNQRKG